MKSYLDSTSCSVGLREIHRADAHRYPRYGHLKFRCAESHCCSQWLSDFCQKLSLPDFTGTRISTSFCRGYKQAKALGKLEMWD